MRLIDTHAHIDSEEFDADRAEVFDRAWNAGLAAIVAVGSDVASSETCVRLAADDPRVFAAVGLHPNYSAQAQPDDWNKIVALANSPRVVALGETGLDCYRDDAPLATQQDWFDRHIRLSQSSKLPFIVHTRESDAEVLAMLREARSRGPLSGVMHSFTGSIETASECIELGMFISFAGMVTFKNAPNLREVAKQIPRDSLLVETDCPWLSPHPLRGKRNEPANVAHTARFLAETRGETFEDLAEYTTANALRLFDRVRL